MSITRHNSTGMLVTVTSVMSVYSLYIYTEYKGNA